MRHSLGVLGVVPAVLGELVRARVGHALGFGQVLLKDLVRVKLGRVHACLATERSVEGSVVHRVHLDERRLAGLFSCA